MSEAFGIPNVTTRGRRSDKTIQQARSRSASQESEQAAPPILPATPHSPPASARVVAEIQEQLQLQNASIGSLTSLLEKLLAQNLQQAQNQQSRRVANPFRLSENRDHSPEEERNVRPTSERYADRTTRLPDPDKLTDGREPSFDYWSTAITGKLTINADHFQSEAARMHYVFDRTSGDAQAHLYPRHKRHAKDPFTTADEMLDYLEEIMVDPHRTEDARHEFRDLKMGPGQSWHDFKTQFFHLADEAEIPLSERFTEMYEKMTPILKKQLLSQRYAMGGDINKLSLMASDVYNGLTRINAQLVQEKKARVSSLWPATSGWNGNRTTSVKERTMTPATATAPTLRTENRFTPRPSPAVNRPEQSSARDTCFHCHQPGHFARECPDKQSLEIKELEEELGPEEWQENEDHSGKACA
jgi:hypothetical protein